MTSDDTAARLTVGYERKLSDGNYGSEGLSMSISVPMEPSELMRDAARTAAIELRVVVLGLLAEHGSERVAHVARYELNPPPSRQPVAAGRPADELEEMPF